MSDEDAPPDYSNAPAEAPPVDGAQLLDDVHAFIDRYVRFPNEHCAVAVTLWAAHTWAVSSFYVTPRLVLDSPEPGSGKTRVLELLALLCRSAKLTLSTTTAALYRRIAAAEVPPTVLQDEADAVFGRNTTPQTEDLRALFNAGYKRGATVDRCEGDSKNMKVREFPVFAPVALAGLAGKMPATITTRSVTIHMRRRAPGETVDPFRERDAAVDTAPLRDRLEAWAEQNGALLADARPPMPAGVHDRPAEVWEALLAVADAAGGQWPDLARAACRHFVLGAGDDHALSLGVRLLRDVRQVFGNRTAMWSAEVIANLVADEESPWRNLWGKELDQLRLAQEMGRYDVKSKNVKLDGRVAKGYRVEGPDGLAQAWSRYLPAPSRDSAATGATSATTQVRASPEVAPPPTEALPATQALPVDIPSDQHKRSEVAPVAEVAPTSRIAVDRCAACRVQLPDALVAVELCTICTAALGYVERTLDKAPIATKTDFVHACSSSDGSRDALPGVLEYAVKSGRIEAVAVGARTKYTLPQQSSSVRTPGRRTGQWLGSGQPVERKPAS